MRGGKLNIQVFPKKKIVEPASNHKLTAAASISRTATFEVFETIGIRISTKIIDASQA